MSRQSAHEGGKVVKLTHRPPLPPGNIPGTHFCQRLNQPQGHSATGRNMPMKNSSDTIENRTRELPACTTVPQPRVLPRTPIVCLQLHTYNLKISPLDAITQLGTNRVGHPSQREMFFSDNNRLALPLGLFTLLTLPTHPTAHMSGRSNGGL